MEVTADHTDLSLRFAIGTTYKVDMTLDNVDFSYPQSKAKFDTRRSKTDDQTTWVTGTMGQGAPGNTLKIDAHNCDVRLIH